MFYREYILSSHKTSLLASKNVYSTGCGTCYKVHHQNLSHKFRKKQAKSSLAKLTAADDQKNSKKGIKLTIYLRGSGTWKVSYQ